jgi:deazaflavin-dependent oxidoreductase (nitroreductase family)
LDLNPVDHLWPVLNRAMKGHAAVYRATNGLLGHRVPFGPPMLLLDHVGAKSGVKRTTPLVYVKDRGDVAVIASKGGNPKHPAWYHNLRANPDTTIQIGSERRKVRARVASDEERERVWPNAVKVWPGYAGYQERTDRKIPVVLLEKRAA